MGALASLTSLAALAGGASAAVSPIGAHSMLQLDDPPSFMEAMFAEAAGMGASTIRLDVAPALVFPDSPSDPDFSGLDAVMALAGQYHLRVVADLMTIPPQLADCPPSTPPSDAARCATDDLQAYGSLISQIVTHADPVIRNWEIWNEPDSGQFFHGSPSQYAWMLRTAHDAIKQVDPQAQVLLGGISSTAGSPWLAQVLAVPGADAAHAFDIANVHERARLDGLAGDIHAWRAMLAGAGFIGPLWITEHGYPSDPAFQYDPGFATGPASQATYLAASLPTLLDAGAAEVFVTERDNLGGEFASEGVLGGNVVDPPVNDPKVVEKPAFAAVRTAAGCYMAIGRDCASASPLAAPAALTLPPARLGSASQATVTVSDPGSEPVAFGPAQLATATPGPLGVEQDDCSGLILEPDERCMMTLRFTPTTAGSLSAALQLPSDQGAIAVPVSATSPSAASLAASPLIRPRGEPDGVGHAQRLTLTISDPLAGPVHVASARVSGRRFSIAADSCAGTSLAPGATCALTVLWRPLSSGTGRGTLTLGGDGRPLVVALRPSAVALPVVTALRLARGGDCLARHGGVAEATADEPATLSWTLRRAPHAVDPRCGRTLTAASPASRSAARGTRSAAGRTRSAAGRTRSAAGRARPADGGTRSVLRLRGARRPGTYRLTAAARNAHGRGPSRTLWLTVA
jgi:Abnormal spindle-like microcephaly-assoc'd, ASPM-SPD-2-Hydin